MIGSNVPTVGGIDKGFNQAKQWNCECIQIYTLPSRKWSVKLNSSIIIEKFKCAWLQSSVKEVISHIPFLVNLASPDENNYTKSIGRLIIELKSASSLGIKYVVLHPGSTLGLSQEEGLLKIINAVNKTIYETKNIKTSILLETMAGQGNVLGHDFEQIAYIINNTIDKSRIGVCFDTCHIFASGYDIRGYEGITDVLNKFEKIVGLKYLKTFHLNDSKAPLGSRVDKHSTIGNGYIGYQAFHYIVTEDKFKKIPKIVENPNREEESQKDIKLLFKLQKNNSKITEPLSMLKNNEKQLDLFSSTIV